MIAAKTTAMRSIFPVRRRAITALLGGLAGFGSCLVGFPAQGDNRLTAQYTISMTGVSIGRIVWIVDIGNRFYAASANGKASGVLSVFLSGDGSIAAQGAVTPQRLAPSTYISNITEDEATVHLHMTFDGSGVKELVTNAPARKDRIPVSAADRRGTTDPLSAVLIPAAAPEEALRPASCARTMPIFDGEVRYDLVLTYKRVEQMKVERGYAGPVLVCNIALHPIAGYRSGSMVIKYIAGRKDMELWLAPIGDTAVIAPVRIMIPTLIGTFEIKAERFEASASTPHENVPASANAPK